MARAPQTPRQLWSDGIHFVRGCSPKDRHPMRFVIGARKSTASLFSRHVQTAEEGIARAREATASWLKANPQDVIHWTEQPATPQAASGEVAESRSAQPTPQAFSNTHFNCIVANPVAQVWQCVARIGERKSGGRRRRDGSPAQAVPINHDIGQCAVMLHREPYRYATGVVIIYPTWVHAAEAALELYDNADEEDRLSWSEGDKRVWATQRIDVIFDPDINGAVFPFSLYLPEYRRPIYEDRTKPVKMGRAKRIDAGTSPQAAIDHREYRKRQRELHREPSFEERTLRFKTIYGAIEEAERRERMLRGEVV